MIFKKLDLPGGQTNEPSLGKRQSPPFLPATPLSPSGTIEGLTLRPSRAIDLPRTLLPEIRRESNHRQVCHANDTGPRTP